MASKHKGRTWLLLAVSVALHLLVSRSVRLLKEDDSQKLGVGLLKRSWDNQSSVSPLSPCSYQHQHVHPTYIRTQQIQSSVLPYDEYYDALPPTLKPFFILALLLILTFLFSFIGITASDFFCPNLSTVASQLGLSESTAGVTFLAFGNGSPDVFSTFSALREGTFGLAIGELIGAASFSKCGCAWEWAVLDGSSSKGRQTC
jgi:sodium/potassium/calcium exchanger 6